MKCGHVRCNRKATHFGFCETHYNFLTNESYGVMLCFNCNSVVRIYRKPSHLERYLFCSKCRRCGGDEDTERQIITFKKRR